MEAQLAAGRGVVSADGEQPPIYSAAEGYYISYFLYQKGLVPKSD